MFRGDRLEALLKEREMSQSALARAVGVAQATIWKLIHEPSQGSKYIYKIAEVLGTSPQYLMGETDDPSPIGGGGGQTAPTASPPENSDAVNVQELDLSYGLGATYIHDVPVTGERRVFSRAWLRMFTKSPIEYLFFATGNGDSMVPTILDADILLIDTFDRTPRMADKLWAVEVGGMGMIKRLRPTKDGEGMRLLSSNKEVPEEVVYDGEMTIIGRVVAVVRKT